MVALMLKGNPLAEKSRVLCIAPELPLTQFFNRTCKVEIITSDLLRDDVDVQADVCKLPFDDTSFDMVIANHVLEHVVDDGVAMAELLRVTRLGGRAILQTPIRWKNETTDEDPSASREERLRRFGQDDHVRYYGRDIVDRLQGAGWHVEMMPVTARFSPMEVHRYGLEADEVFLALERR